MANGQCNVEDLFPVELGTTKNAAKKILSSGDYNFDDFLSDSSMLCFKVSSSKCLSGRVYLYLHFDNDSLIFSTLGNYDSKSSQQKNLLKVLNVSFPLIKSKDTYKKVPREKSLTFFSQDSIYALRFYKTRLRRYKTQRKFDGQKISNLEEVKEFNKKQNKMRHGLSFTYGYNKK